MDFQIVNYNPDDYHDTKSRNKIHRRTLLRGSKNIQITGNVLMKEKVIVRGDLAPISLGSYLSIFENVIIRPSYKKDINEKIKFIPLSIGDNVIILQDSVIEAQKIGSNVRIGRNCIISHRCIIGDCVIVNDDSIVPPDTVIPSYTQYSGRPALFVQELPEQAIDILKEMARNLYRSYVPIQK